MRLARDEISDPTPPIFTPMVPAPLLRPTTPLTALRSSKIFESGELRLTAFCFGWLFPVGWLAVGTVGQSDDQEIADECEDMVSQPRGWRKKKVVHGGGLEKFCLTKFANWCMMCWKLAEANCNFAVLVSIC